MLLNSRTQSHAFHLTTKSYAEHKALQAYYEGIVPLLDAYAEAVMGKYGRKTRTESKALLSLASVPDPSPETPARHVLAQYPG